MKSSLEIPIQIASFPMGPHMISVLGIVEGQYLGHLNMNPSESDCIAYQEFLLDHLDSISIESSDQLTDVIEELIGMNFPILVVKFAQAFHNLVQEFDFRTQLHLGNAYMMIGDFASAEFSYKRAQSLILEEPAPYINLVQIYCEEARFALAETWCQAGLKIDPNNTKLWEFFTWIQRRLNQDLVLERVEEIAKQLNSWAGKLLSIDLLETDPMKAAAAKLIVLNEFYQEGIRADDFLIEYTAVLGLNGQYEKIPLVIWQQEKSGRSTLPWQLYAHSIQALMGLGRDDQAMEIANKTLTIKGLSPSAITTIRSMQQELNP